MKIVKHKKGQFIIFATLIIAIMIISIGTIMYSTITYFKHERWQEYLMVIDNIELGSRRVVELSLANYTMLNGTNNQILINNLNNWRTNLTNVYPGFGVALTYSPPDQGYKAYFHTNSYSPYVGVLTPGFMMNSTVPSGSFDNITLVDGGTPVWFYQSPIYYNSYAVPKGNYSASFWAQAAGEDDADLYWRIKYYDKEGIKNITDVGWKDLKVYTESVTNVVINWSSVESWTMPAGGGFAVEIYAVESDVTLYVDSADYPSHIEVPLPIPQSVQAYGVTINYVLGLSRYWYSETSFSAANATISVDLASTGLIGYRFMAIAFLRMKILNATWDSQDLTIHLTVDKEESTPIVNLQKSNFVEVKVDGQPKNFTLTSQYSETYSSFIYEIRCTSQTQPSSVEVAVIDARNIKVIANSTVT